MASGATPLFVADPPTPGLTLDCPKDLALGEAGSVADVLSGSADKPIGRQDVTITRTDEFGALPVDVGAERTTSQGMFGPISNTPANRGKNTYQVSFAGDKDFAAAQRRVSARSTAPPPR
ncbi:MAG: hypothetical protein ACRDQD_03435 [Nocardioidaceae bacterium]